MPRSLQELEAEALQLPVEARGRLVARLLESLEPSDAEIQQLWIWEAERRANELRSGQVRSEPLEEALQRGHPDPTFFEEIAEIGGTLDDLRDAWDR